MKPFKQRPYRLNPKYKEKVFQELDKMLDAGIIELVEESDWKIKIVLEDRGKTTFTIEWGCVQYTVMPFGLNNVPTIFSCIVIATFKEFIHNFLEVYFDDWTTFGLVKHHLASLCLMLGHVMCKKGLMVDPAKIVVIVSLEAPRNIKQLCVTLRHTGYYRKFIKAYAQITVPMEKLLKKDVTFCWDEECQRSLDVLK
eukprot:PITA_24967